MGTVRGVYSFLKNVSTFENVYFVYEQTMNRTGKMYEILIIKLYKTTKIIKHAQKNTKGYCFWGKNVVHLTYENDLVIDSEECNLKNDIT